MDRIDASVRHNWAKRWYSFNKQKIPMIFTLIGTFFFTAFLDFNIQGTDIQLKSHIAALRQLTGSTLSNMAALFLFCMYLISIIQLFNTVAFSKTRSPFSIVLISILTLTQVALVVCYTAVFFVERANRPDYIIDSSARLAYTVCIIGAILFLIATVFAWFYVDWKYVKQKEE